MRINLCKGLKQHIVGKLFLVPVLLLISVFSATAQNHTEYVKATPGHEYKHFRVSAVMYHIHIITQTLDGKEFLSVPSVGLDVEYWFNRTWGIGAHNDLELITYVEENEGIHTLERETPVLFTADALWKPWKELVVLVGPGVEFQKEENLFVVRGGLEYEIDLGGHWDVSPTVFYDKRIGAYDTFSVGIGIGKRF